MNHYPLWKNLLIIFVLALGVFYALPNKYGRSPVVQTSAIKNQAVDATLLAEISKKLKAGKISDFDLSLEKETVITRFTNIEDQLIGKEIIDGLAGYKSAINLKPNVPQWLTDAGGKAMNLGLDLRGGVYFLMEVDMEEALENKFNQLRGDAVSILSKAKISKKSLKWQNDKLTITFKSAELAEKALQKLRQPMDEVNFKHRQVNGVETLIGTIREKAIDDIKNKAIEQNISTIRSRVNEFGVAEPIVQKQGADRIVVQLPGVQDSSEIKDTLGSVATLEYRAVNMSPNHNAYEIMTSGKPAPLGYKLYKDQNGQPVLLSKRIIVSGDQLIDATAGTDQQDGRPQVSVRLNNLGAKRMLEFTRKNVGNNMAVVFKERVIAGKDPETKKNIYEEVQTVISNAVINGVFSNRFQTTGLESSKFASKLALQLRSGSLAAPVEIVREKTIGPSLGQDNIDNGFKSVLTGFVLVLIFMLIYYRMFGVVANIALSFNVVLIVAVLSLFGATLTLPGIAGIVLTVGMAVDANVLIFERIKEELRLGNTAQGSIKSGYEKALSTIADANITTFIAAIVLFAFGTGPIKGFAVTLSIGIITSMFTAIMVSRAIVNLIYGNKTKLKSLSI
ncbi:Protein translocase subunit SecD [hydrothermal vent metagenome]|uniref:Protein translocase subunit SecD n=1 Tax=hydrothermal vent metagenome TaxID=652676 RepID=A0A3B0V233_9ZZZZ